jgi:hypothetical protein
MRSILPSPWTVHWGHFDARLKPVAEVESSEVFHLRIVTGFPGDPVPPEWIAPELYDLQPVRRVRKSPLAL